MKTLTFSRALTLALAGLAVTPLAIVLTPTAVVAAPAATIFAAIDLHNAARDGDGAATEKAVAAFEALVSADPDNAQVVAYLGSSYALTARDASAVVDKIRYTNRGLRFLDQAVTMAPADFSVRMIRGSVTANLPAMFGRADSTVEDFLALDQMFTAQAAPTMAPPMIGVYTQLAALAPDQGDWTAKLDAARAMASGN